MIGFRDRSPEGLYAQQRLLTEHRPVNISTGSMETMADYRHADSREAPELQRKLSTNSHRAPSRQGIRI